ncbi:hypothetical protein QJS04_geneDACA009294 [Acorus gramineus]|uniref:Uncharacterized protein n=1 Tax=Acorus gramineus TaxID=55184 RepID=A0AAV9A2J2_ACOGR|nr:hypothetical protein QJS04_geneDACA009294 [Acorus gramineus]
MKGLPEITHLFTKLASDLRSSEVDNNDHTLVSLNETLNLDRRSEVRVLDAALSILCFKAPQVFDSTIERTVETIVSVLRSSTCCGVGSSISLADYGELMGWCVDALEKLKGRDVFSSSLFRSVLEVTASASRCHCLFQMPSMDDAKPDENDSVISKLSFYIPEEASVNNNEVPLRLLIWYLEPMTLKNDISMILLERVQRPFLSLKIELRQRMAWRWIVVCLVTSPTIFMTTRSLLHKWFLMTGLPCILELQNEIVSCTLDLLSSPTKWGVPMELGLNLPFPNVYFPAKQQRLLKILSGSVSCERLLDLVSIIGETYFPVGSGMDSSSCPPLDGTHEQNTAMLMDFPTWFYFAAALVFCGKFNKDSFASRCILRGDRSDTDLTYNVQLHHAAARYLSCILSPIDEMNCESLINHIIEISGSWDPKNKKVFSCQSLLRPSSQNENTAGRWKKLKKPKVIESERQPNILYTRIPLGILIANSMYLDEKEYELLLHYAVTGEIIELEQAQIQEKLVQQSGEEVSSAVAGLSLVFDLFDIIGDISAAVFDCDESQLDYICQAKSKVNKYLFKCIRKLREPPCQVQTKEEAEVRGVMLKDLYERVSRWRLQGREMFEGCDTFIDLFSTSHMVQDSS